MRFLNSKLKIENTILQNIAKKYGTPAYCYSYKQLRENINDFKKNFKSISPLIVALPVTKSALELIPVLAEICAAVIVVDVKFVTSISAAKASESTPPSLITN